MLKKIMALSLVFGAFSSLALADEVVKTCSFDVKMPGVTRVVPTTYQIMKSETGLVANTVQIIDGQSVELPKESVQENEFTVRPNIAVKTDDMNDAELLIAGTIEFLQTPEIGSAFTVGLDLKSIRTAKIYQIGKATHMGSMAIIEAKDEKGNDLGSFVTGFMPFACAR